MNWKIFLGAFGAGWAFVANVLSKVPFLSTALKVLTGPLGAVLGPVTQAIVDALTSVANFFLAYIKVFFDGLKVTMNNLSVLAVIFAAFVGGISYGVHIDRSYLPATKATVKQCKPVIDSLHKDYWFIAKKKNGR